MISQIKEYFKTSKQLKYSLSDLDYMVARRKTDLQYNIRLCSPFQQYVIDFLEEDFAVLDIGCSGGINKNWLDVFGDKLVGYGIDANVEEINKLKKTNHNKKLHYISGFINSGGDNCSDLLESRSAACLGRGIMSKKFDKQNVDQIQQNNMYHLADQSNNVISISDFLDKNNIKSIDFVKVDLDGIDHLFLEDLKDYFTSTKIMGFLVEQLYARNIVGERSYDKDDKVPNYLTIGKLMHEFNYRFFDIVFQVFESSAIPGRFVYEQQAQNVHGRLAGGDALYMLDPCEPDYHGPELSGQKLLKLVILYDMHKKTSWAAELLVAKRQDFERLDIDVKKCLNLLIADLIARDGINFIPKNPDNLHEEYIQYFKEDPTRLYKTGSENLL